MKVLLTPMQREIVHLIRSYPGIEVSELARLVYYRKKNRPLQPTNSINILIRRINTKIKNQQIVGDGGKGRRGKKVWLVKK